MTLLGTAIPGSVFFVHPYSVQGAAAFRTGYGTAGEAAPPGQVLVRLPGRCTVWVDMNERSGYSRAIIIAHDVQACLPPGGNFLKVPEPLILCGFSAPSFCG